MTKNEFLIYIYTNSLVERWGGKQLQMIPPHIREDVVQEVYLLIAEYEDDKYNSICSQGFKHLTAFFRQFVINSLTPTGKTRGLIRLFTKEECRDFSENNDRQTDNAE